MEDELKGNLHYSNALSEPKIANKTSHLLFPFALLWYKPHEHNTQSWYPVLMNSPDLQMSVRAVGVRETGVVVKGGHVPF